jgi:hypothetical protein
MEQQRLSSMNGSNVSVGSGNNNTLSRKISANRRVNLVNANLVAQKMVGSASNNNGTNFAVRKSIPLKSVREAP